jgi:hypothetical protein
VANSLDSDADGTALQLDVFVPAHLDAELGVGADDGPGAAALLLGVRLAGRLGRGESHRARRLELVGALGLGPPPSHQSPICSRSASACTRTS